MDSIDHSGQGSNAQTQRTEIKVRDFVGDSELGLRVVVEGDLGLPVGWVHVTELLDPSPYVSGGEFILSAGIWNASEGRASSFVEALAREGTSALGWGLLSEEESVPDGIVAACREQSLTLVEIPTKTPFIALGRWFFERSQEIRESGLRRHIERNERFVRSISSLPGGLRGILNALRETTGLPLRVADASGRSLANSPADEAPFPAKIRDFDLPAGDGSQSRLTVGLPDGEALTEERLSAVRQAMPLIEFVISYERELREAEKRLAGELVEAVLARRNLFAAGRLSAYGLEPEGNFIGVVALPESGDDLGSVLEAARRFLAPLGAGAVVAADRRAVTVFVQTANHTPEEVASELNALCEAGSGCFVGVGERASGVEGLRRSLVQARQAALAARRGRPEGSVRGGCLVHARAESYTLLLALGDEDALASFRETLLGTLEDCDRRRGSNLTGTLAAFLASGGKWQKTAQELHIHVNTLRHRLTRCEELTGRSLDSMDNRVDLYVALRSREARG